MNSSYAIFGAFNIGNLRDVGLIQNCSSIG